MRIWSIPLLFTSERWLNLESTASGALTRNRRLLTGLPCSMPGSYHHSRRNRPACSPAGGWAVVRPVKQATNPRPTQKVARFLSMDLCSERQQPGY